MIIANPIYDVVFKRMMENDKVAKFFIGTLINQPIDTIDFKPQEFTVKNKLANLSFFRLDFIATIKTKSGEYIKVIIEIQKARNHIDLMRFRNYLAENYKKEDTVNGETLILPIIPIYILGFNLPEIETACIKIERNYKDLLSKKIISKKSDFIEKLTHDSFIVQVNRISGKFQSRLDKLLSLFEQSNFIDDKKYVKEFTHKIDSEDLKIVTDILHHTGVDPKQKKLIEIELEAWRSIYAGYRENEIKYFKDLKIKEEELKIKDSTIAEKDNAIAEKDNAIADKDNTIAEKDNALADKDNTIAELLMKLGIVE
jgi:hypothetical protein